MNQDASLETLQHMMKQLIQQFQALQQQTQQQFQSMEQRVQQMTSAQLLKRETNQLPSQPVPNPRVGTYVPQNGENEQPKEQIRVVSTQEDKDSVSSELSEFEDPEEIEDSDKEEDMKTSYECYKLQSMAPRPIEDLPPKRNDPGKPVIPCYIGGQVFYDTLLDVGASINAMSATTCKRLNISTLEKPSFTLELADDSVIHPIGIARDIVITIKGHQFPADFAILDMEDSSEIILGRPFLSTANAVIDFPKGTVKFSWKRKSIEIKIFENILYHMNSMDKEISKLENKPRTNKEKTVGPKRKKGVHTPKKESEAWKRRKKKKSKQSHKEINTHGNAPCSY